MQSSRLCLHFFSIVLAGYCTGMMHGQTAADLRFTAPMQSRLQGTVDLEVTAPTDTTAVRFFLDGTQLSELTDDYAVATKTAPIWHTVMATEYFAPGPHELSAVATTTGGAVRTSMRVDFAGTVSATSINLDGGWRFSAAADLPLGSMEGPSPRIAAPGFDDRSWTSVVVPNSLDAVDKRWMSSTGLLGVQCPASFVPVELIETGYQNCDTQNISAEDEE